MKKITLILFVFCGLITSAQNKLTSSLSESYDGTAWTNSSKSTFMYDSNNNLTLETGYYWNSTLQDWEKSFEDSYSYNANNKVTNYSYVSYSNGTTQISYQYRTKYTYNNDGNVIQILDEEYENNSWVNDYKIDLTYSNGKVTGGLSYEWNGSIWVFDEDSSETTINYNSDGTISAFINKAWNGSAWVDDSRTLYTYDANKRVVLEDSQTWNGSVWVSDYKLENTFDANGNIVVEKESYLENGVFVVAANETITFDLNEQMSAYAHPFKDKSGLDFLVNSNGIVNKIVSRISSDNNFRTTYLYNGATASVKDVLLTDFKTYPNPVKDFLTIDNSNFVIKSLSLYNVLGKKVLSTTQNQLDFKNLNKGVYVLKIETDKGKIGTTKIVKK
ncbi:T9SS type A sorting domain-containing protein [Polaribacter sp. OB-PA-B3]